MGAAEEYAPPSAIVGVIVVGLALIALGAALYRRPQIGWTMARFRMSKAEIDRDRHTRGAATEKGFRLLALGLVVGGLFVIGTAIKSALT